MTVCNLFVIFQCRCAIMDGCVTCDIKNSYSMYMGLLLLTFQYRNTPWKLHTDCVDCNILVIYMFMQQSLIHCGSDHGTLCKIMLFKLLLGVIWLYVCGFLWTPLSQMLKIQTLLNFKDIHSWSCQLPLWLSEYLLAFLCVDLSVSGFGIFYLYVYNYSAPLCSQNCDGWGFALLLTVTMLRNFRE